MTRDTHWPPFDFDSVAGFGDSRLRLQLRGLLESIMADQRSREILTSSENASARMDFATGRRNDGSHRLRHFYWSAQAETQDGFSARTLTYYRKDDAPRWLDFPHDPDLPHIQPVMARHAPVKMLRYIPLRRLTYVAHDASGQPAVVKVKRPERIAEAAKLLQRIGELARRESVEFSVPALLGSEPKDASMILAFCEGESLQESAVEPGEKELAGLGVCLHGLHRMPAAGLTTRSFQDALDAAMDMAQWLAAMHAPCAADMAEVRKLLSGCTAADATAVFCHGDFNASQVLFASGRWTFLDFDAAHRGNACADIAKFAVRLNYMAPARASSENLVASVISGYERASGSRLDPHALNFHLACAELHNLQQMIKKGRFDAVAFAGGIVRIHHALERAAA